MVDGFMYPNEVELQWSILIVLYPYITGLVAGAFILASLERVFHVEAVKPTYRLALLTALVGSIGLMGTMSMNVMDRTREIGVMRAIGASDRAVMNMVIVEGMLIGLFGCLFGVLASIPISKVMSDVVTEAIFDAPSRFTFSLTGPIYWLGLVLLLALLASVLPARNAARITIREALAYE